MSMPRRLLGIVLLCALTAGAEVHQTYFVERTDVLGGRSLGSAGPYERIIANVIFQLDPANQANRIITDIDLAPRNEDGLVEFSADLYVLKPRDPSRGNGTMLFDVLNRGRKIMLGTFNMAPSSLDPRTDEELGDGFLMEQGYTLVWLGWQFDVPKRDSLMKLRPAVAKKKDGSPVTGVVRSDFVVNKRVRSHLLSDRSHIAYPVLDPKDKSIQLTVRDRNDGPRTTIARDEWQFAREKNGNPVADSTSVYMADGFEPGKIYEVVYTSKDPALVGLGPTAVRDIVSFFKYGISGRRAHVLSDQRAFIKRAIGFGTSQSGRFLRTFLYYGFNKDEKDRQVFDGVWSHVAGGGRGSFNHRFAQASRDAHPHMNFFWPTDIYPFSDLEQRDPETGLNEGILSRARRDGVVPRIFYTNSSYEYWGRAASLIHTTLDGKRDFAPARDTRIYLLAGTQHGARTFPPGKSGTRNLSNPNDYRWAMRALLVSFNDWLTKDKEPPPSQYPRIAAGELAPHTELSFPKVPGVDLPARMHRAYWVDYGPNFRSEGVVTVEPPKVGKAFPTLVPQVDGDGNETSGIRLPVVAAPLGSFTGWNLRDPSIGAPGELYSMVGSYIPFARTKAERERSGDQRRSVEERYANRDDYLSKLRAAAEKLAEERYVLPADVWKIVDTGAAQWDFVMK